MRCSVTFDCLLRRRIWCERYSTLFYRLWLFDDREKLRRTIDQVYDVLPDQSWHGVTLVANAQRGQGPWQPNEVGAIALSHYDVQVIAHEATHAALGWFLRRKLTMDLPGRLGYASEAEERFCHVVDSLVGQIYWRCRQAGLIEG